MVNVFNFLRQILFFEMGEPQPLQQNDAYGHLLFELFSQSRQKALHRSYKPEPPKKGVKGSKHHHTSTKLEE
jgi:hypothetical protein